MKIVIDIDDDRYEKIINNEVYVPLDICVALYNGTPLPEGHGRLIDADAIPRHLVRDIDEIDKQPTIIEESESE